MPVVNDFPGLYEKIKAAADQLAARIGVQKEVLYGYFNDTGHFPQTLDELTTWGNKVDPKYGVSRRDPQTGAWHPIMPGVNPDPRLTSQDRGGFAHNITNAEDSDIQRFQTVDPRGLPWGGSWDPQYNAAHPELAGKSGFDAVPMAAPGGPTQSNAPAMQRTAAATNPYKGTPYEAAWEQANPSGQPFGTGTPTPSSPAGPPATSASPAASPAAPGTTPTGSTGSGLGPLIDAAAYGNTATLQASIDDAIRRYALARTDAERNQAYLDLQRYQTELGKIQNQQKTTTDLATSILSAATSLGNRPADYVKFNQVTSGGRDIFDQISGKGGPVAAYGGPTGQVQPGSVWDLLGRLGVSYPQTPATPASVQPGAPNPSLPGLPQVPVPTTTTVGGGTTPAAGAAPPTALPTLGDMLKGLDQAAGGSWTGNRADPNAVAQAWWDADPNRRGKARPAMPV